MKKKFFFFPISSNKSQQTIFRILERSITQFLAEKRTTVSLMIILEQKGEELLRETKEQEGRVNKVYPVHRANVALCIRYFVQFQPGLMPCHSFHVSRDSARHRREVMYTALQVMYRADKGKEGGVNDQQRVKRVMC